MQFSVENEADVMSYFDHYIPPELIETAVDRTNLYAQQIAKMPRPVTKHARSEEWKPVIVIEMKKFPWFDFCNWYSPLTKIRIVLVNERNFQTQYFHKQCLGTDFNLSKSTFTSVTIMQQEQTKIICTKSVQF